VQVSIGVFSLPPAGDKSWTPLWLLLCKWCGQLMLWLVVGKKKKILGAGINRKKLNNLFPGG